MSVDPGKEKKNSGKTPERKADSAENVAGKHVTRGSVRDNSTDVKQGNSRKGQTDASLNLEELLELIAADQDYPLDQLKHHIGFHGVQYEILKAFRKREAALRAKLEKEAEKSRKEVEDRLEKLRHSEERYRTLQANIPVGIFRSTPTGKILSANLALVRMLGYDSEEELCAVSVRDLYLLAERRREFIKNLESAGSATDFEAQMRQKDGSGLWVSLSATAVKDDKGKVHFDGIIEDITERKRAEEELREREELYRTLVDTAQEGITIVDLDENMVFVNPRMAEFFGYEPDKLIGRSFLDFVPPEEAELIRSQTSQRRQGETSRYELTLVHKNGTHQRVLIAAAPLYDAEGKPYAAIGVFTDITDRKRAEEELKRRGDKLRESEELYRTLVDAAQEAIILDDPDENIVFINPTAARLLGYPPEELIGRSLFDFIPPEEVKALRSQTAYRITKQESSRYELTLVHQSGSSRRMLVTGAPVYDAEGKIKATMGVFTDITELSVLVEIGRAISSTLDVNEIYGVIHEQVKRLINADNFYIAHYSKEADEVTFPYAFQEGRLKPWASRRGGKGMTEYVIRTGRPHLSHGDSKEEAAKIGVELIGKTSHSWLGVPMIIRNEVIGVMAVQSFDPEITYSEKDMGFMETVAHQAAQAVENARAYFNLEQRLTELSVFNEIGRALSSTLKMDELMDVLLNQTRRLMYADDFFIASYDEDTNVIEFPLYLEKGEVTELPARPFGQGMTEHVISSREPLLIQGENFEQTCKRLGIEMILHGEPALSWLGVPMVSHDKVLGIISVQSTEESHVFDENHTRLLASIANQAAGAFANARAYSKLERKLTELSIFNEVGYALGSTLDLDELLKVIYTQTSRVMDTESFYIALCDENAGVIEFPLYMKDGKPMELPARPFGKGLTEHVIKKRKSLLIKEDVANAALKLGIGRVVTGAEAKCWLGVPMIFQDRVIGVMTVQSTRKAGLYDEDHERLLSSMANQAAGAVANARGYSELEERLTELSVFNEIGTALGSVLEFDELLDVIYQQTGRVMDTDQFYISLYDEKTKTIEFPLVIEKGKRVETASRKFGNSISERVITTRSPLLIKRDFRKTLHDIGADIILEEGEAEPLCWLGVPMISADKVVGVMVVQSVDKEEVFDEDDRRILATIASQAAGAIANARAYAMLERSGEELKALLETSSAVSATLDEKKVAHLIAVKATELIGANGCTVYRFDPGIEELVPITTTVVEGREEVLGHHISVGEGITGQAAAEKRAILANNVHHDPKAARIPGTKELPTCLLSAPLTARGDLLGVMTLVRFSEEEFVDHDLELFILFARQVAEAAANSRLFGRLRELNKDLERRGEELGALFNTSTELSSTLDEKEVGELIARKATELIGADGCTVYRFDPETEKLIPQITTNKKNTEAVMGYHPLLGEGTTGRAVKERRPILANHVHLESKSAHVPGTKREPTCLLSAPLISKGELLGGMTISRLSDREFTEHDLQVFTLFARQAAEAFANSRLFGRLRSLNKDLQTRREELQALFKTSTELSSILEEEETGKLIAQRAKELIASSGCTFYKFDKESAKLIPIATTVMEEYEQRMAYQVPLGEGITGKAAKERNPILANNIHLDSKAPRIPGTEDLPTCLLSAPLVARDELLGVMTLVRMSEDEFTEHDLQLFTLFVRQAAEAFANTRLFTQLRELNESLEQKVAGRTTELERAKVKLEEVHSDYKERVRARLATLTPIMEKVSLGDFNENISLHEKEDEFTELFVGLNLMIDDLRFMFEENRRRGEELRELNEDLQRRSGELRELLEASTVVAATLEEEAVAKLIGDRATNFIRAARCTVYRFDPEAEELIPQMTTSKEDRDKILGCKIKLGEGVTGRAAAERKSIIANNVHLDPKAPRIPGTQERPTCLLSVPLLSKGELLGVMTLTRLSEEKFIEHDRELFTLFSRQVADATANSRLHSRLQDLNENLEAIVAQRTSELKESNRKTAAFARELEEVIYVTSHDLKTPLRAISGFSQFLYEDYRDKLDMEGKLYLTRLIDAVKRMEKLLDDVLDITAVTRTGQVFKDVPAGDLIKEAIKMVDVGDDADIIYNPDELPTVLCDSAKMVEVFYNLISNGLKFNDKPRKQVKITAQTSGGSHEFIFSDNGIGIEKRHYERIFQIFQRLHQREDYSGTGVGLSMVKRVVEEHNGRIWVESQVGVGTIFHFTLPLHQEEDNEAANPERSM